MLIVKPLNDLAVYLTDLVQKRLWLKVIIGLVLGIGVGLMLNPSTGIFDESIGHSLSNWLNLPGEIFMKLAQMVMIPLIFASIISGLVSNVSDRLKTFGLWLFLYFIGTTTIAIGIGVAVAFIFNPGDFVRERGGLTNVDVSAPEVASSGGINLPDTISNLIPVNPLQAILSGDMLPIIVFTIIIGIAITQLDINHSRPLIRFIEAIQKICMIVVGWAMRLVPYAVFGLIAALVSATGIDVFVGLGYYMMVVILGLLILFCVYLIIYSIVIKKNPIEYLKSIKDAQLLAFSTASSAAVMPLTMKTADENLGVSSKVSDFVIPIGATINMDGTALFQCVTVLFMAQSYGVELNLITVLLLTVTVVSASIGTPAIPGGGVIVLATVLQSTGIPSEGLIVIIGIDRILGMFRTAVNVTGDLTATVVFNKWFGSSDKTSQLNSDYETNDV